MGVNISQVSQPSTPMAKSGNDSNNSNNHGTRKKKYAVSDLPFSKWSIDSRKWRTHFVPLLIAWAGTQEDPFGTNSQMANKVTALWQRIYPAIVLNDARTVIILAVVCTSSLPS